MEGASLEPPPKRFTGFGSVVIFVGIAVMISLVWTQMQQAKLRSKPILATQGDAPQWFVQPLLAEPGILFSSTEQGNSILVVHFLRSVQTVEAAMMRDRLITVLSALESIKDNNVRVVTVFDGPVNDPDAVRAFFADLPGIQKDATGSRHVLALPVQAIGGNPDAQQFRERFFYKTPGQDDGEYLSDSATETRFVIIDDQSQVRAYRDGRNPEAGSDLLQDIGGLVREQKQAQFHRESRSHLPIQSGVTPLSSAPPSEESVGDK